MKQNALTASTGLVLHEKLLEGTKVKSLVAGDNITMTSTGEFVSISADLTTVNTQLATKANQATTYTKTEVDTAITNKVPPTVVTFGPTTTQIFSTTVDIGGDLSVTGPIYSGNDQVLTTYTGYTKTQVDT